MSSVYKLRIHQWAAKAPINLLSCRLAQQLAVSADWVYDLILWLRNGRIDRSLPLVHLSPIGKTSTPTTAG